MSFVNVSEGFKVVPKNLLAVKTRFPIISQVHVINTRENYLSNYMYRLSRYAFVNKLFRPRYLSKNIRIPYSLDHEDAILILGDFFRGRVSLCFESYFVMMLVSWSVSNLLIHDWGGIVKSQP